MSEVVICKNDGKSIGQSMNALAREGKVLPVSIGFSDDRPHINANCIFAATDWLKDNGFYNENSPPPCNHYIY